MARSKKRDIPTLQELESVDRHDAAKAIGRDSPLRADRLPPKFPKPFYINNRPMWLVSEIAVWKQAQVDARPGMKRDAGRVTNEKTAA